MSSSPLRSGAPRSTGRSSDEAAAATTATGGGEQVQRAWSGRPRNASQTPSAASRTPASSIRASTSVLRRAEGDDRDHAADHDGDAQGERRPPAVGGEPEGGGDQRGRQGEQDEFDRERVVGGAGQVGDPRRRVDVRDLDVAPPGICLRELRAQRLRSPRAAPSRRRRASA